MPADWARQRLATMRVTAAILMLMCGMHGQAAEHESAWAQAARAHDIDPVTLYAVALQESRALWTDGTARPWPWTLRSARDGTQRFGSRTAALEALEALLGAGERNIDVGLMQINWGFNGHRVDAPEALLDPHRNVLVGAEILRDALRAHAGDLARALGAYHHGPDTERGRAYSAEVRRRIHALRSVAGLRRRLTDPPPSADGGVPR